MAEEIHIVLSSNERYMPGATVALAGVAVHARPETRLHFHVFTDEDVRPGSFDALKDSLVRIHPKSIVEQHRCDESMLAGFPEYAGSRMTWVRCFYARILKDVDWALYLDCDILYLASPEEHFSYRDENVYACVSRDMSEDTANEDRLWARSECGIELDISRYFNAGVMLFNFRKFREDSIPEKVADFIKQHPRSRYADQTAMNVLFNNGGVSFVPTKYDWLQVLITDEALKSHPVIHYVCGIPWLPKLSVVANGRFRLWHAFADKYIWRKRGESCRRLFTKRVLFAKQLFYYLLKAPGIGRIFAATLEKLGVVSHGDGWRAMQTGYDVKMKTVREVLRNRGGHA